MRATAALLVLAGCRLITRELSTQSGCNLNRECAAAQICWFGECVTPLGDPSDRLYLSLRPTGRQQYFPQTQEITVSGGRTTPTWKPNYALSGRVSVTSGVPPAGLGSLRLTKPSVTGGTQSVEIDVTVSYAANIEEGVYTALFTPDASSAFGQVRLADWEVKSDATKDIEMPTRRTQIFGRLLSSPDDPIPRESATVFAVADNGLLSSTSTTNETGDFSFFLAGAPSGFTVVVGPSKDNPFLPEVQVPVAASGNNIQIYVPDIGSTTTISGRAIGRIDGQDFELPFATVVATTDIGGGRYRTATTTSSTGDFALPVIRGAKDLTLTYTLEVRAAPSVAPKINQEFGRAQLTYMLASSGTPPEIDVVVPPRGALSGTVRVPGIAPVQGIAVSARLVAEGVPARTTNTNSDGGFTLPLDPGDYELSFVPPAGVRAARTYTRVTMTDRDLVIDDVALPDPLLLVGELTGSGVSLNGTMVSCLRLIDGIPVVVGEATVKAIFDTESKTTVGHFSMVIPK